MATLCWTEELVVDQTAKFDLAEAESPASFSPRRRAKRQGESPKVEVSP